MNDFWDDLTSSVRPYLGYLAGFSFLLNLLYLAPAMFSLQIFDRVLPGNSQQTLAMLLLGSGAALMLVLALDYLRNRMQAIVGAMLDECLAPSVAQMLVARAARAPHAGGIEGMRDVATLQKVFTSNGMNALFDAPWAPLFVLLIWSFHPALGMGAALAALLMLTLAWLNDRLSRRALEQVQTDARQASRYLESSLRNAEILQALGMTDKLLARWRLRQDGIAALQARTQKGALFFTSLTRFARQAVQMMMLALGAWLVLEQQASAGVMIATTILLARALQPIEQIVGAWRLLADARGAWLRLRSMAREAGREPERMSLPRPQGRLVVEAASFRPPGGRQQVLFGVGFSLEPGQALAIIGPSGAGKSSLARLLTGIWEPLAGSVRLDGADLSRWPRADLGPWIGYVPQDVELFEGSVADNIARLGAADAQAVVAAAMRAGVHELILALPDGYDTEVGQHGILLSPGQRQRIALARALYGDPRLVVLDEPNANLDGAGEAALALAVARLRSDGVTSVIITHRPSLIAHVDRILVLEGGRIQQFGPAAQIIQSIRRQAPATQDGKAA
jgi:ATP-binding cassette subfamily C exporter for protease/lipase/ATP-binding cassette subfamily C protein EexD